MLAASVDDEQVSRQCVRGRGGEIKLSDPLNDPGRERACRSKVTSKDDLPPAKSQLRTTSQYRVRAVHITVWTSYAPIFHLQLFADNRQLHDPRFNMFPLHLLEVISTKIGLYLPL
jgi:hypothetical protein